MIDVHSISTNCTRTEFVGTAVLDTIGLNAETIVLSLWLLYVLYLNQVWIATDSSSTFTEKLSKYVRQGSLVFQAAKAFNRKVSKNPIQPKA